MLQQKQNKVNFNHSEIGTHLGLTYTKATAFIKQHWPGKNVYTIILLCTIYFVLSTVSHAQAEENVPVPGSQVPQLLDTTITIDEQRIVYRMGYLLYLPKTYDSTEKKWPLLMFLHGLGEAGNNLSVVSKIGIPNLLKEPEKYPFLSEKFIVISPQNPVRGQRWSTDTLSMLIGFLKHKYLIDTNRIYYTGYCSGGEGCYDFGTYKPSIPAAIAFFSMYGSGVDGTKACNLTNVQCRFYHGDADHVPWVDAKSLSEKIDNCNGGNSEFLLYEGEGHSLIDKVYPYEDLYTWFLAQSKDNTTKDDTLKLIEPLGHNVYKIGDTLTVRWRADTNEVKAVTISVSPNGGKYWHGILEQKGIFCNDPSWGKYTWEIPESIQINDKDYSMVTDSFKVKVEEYSVQHVSISDCISIHADPAAVVSRKRKSGSTKLYIQKNSIIMESDENSNGGLYISDLRGRRLFTQSYRDRKTLTTRLPAFSSGMYIVQWVHGTTSIKGYYTVR